jgi:hypothetical protein
MAISNGYTTLVLIKDALNINDATKNTLLEASVEAASRQIDRYCSRHFWQESTVTARVYASNKLETILVDDISTTTGLIVKTDEDGDGTFENTWASTDYQLEPLNNLSRTPVLAAYRLTAIGDYYFPVSQEALVQVTAKWGWPAVPTDIQTAALIQSIMLFKALDAPFGVAGSADVGELRIQALLHPTARALAEAYKRHTP